MMPRHRLLSFIIPAAFFFQTFPLLAQDDTSDATNPTTEQAEQSSTSTEPVTTEHQITINNQIIRYRATAGYLVLPDYEGEPRANMFYVAYERILDDAQAPSQRPITFAFNGGPGSSSVWLHLGALGPRRVVMEADGQAPPPPYQLVDNEYSWLDFTDLVFIDPVTTGYSRPVDDVDGSDFHGLEKDIQSVGEFIRLWTTQNNRWQSPKYLAGESYGTTRAAGLAQELQQRHGMYLNGITLISPVLNFQTVRFATGNDDPYWLFLPTYTATAFYHDKLSGELAQDLDQTLKAVQLWARTDYLMALASGDALEPKKRDQIATQLARFTGLSKRFVLDSNLRINIFNFTKELLRDQHKTIGRLDSRFTGLDLNWTTTSIEHDPSYTAILGPFTATLNAYIRQELEYKNDLNYEILTSRVQPWSYARFENRYTNVAGRLASAMSRNQDLKVLVCSGYFDLATPYFAMEHTVSHMGLDPSIAGNISTVYYNAGHMMYIRHQDLVKFKADVARFYSASNPNH